MLEEQRVQGILITPVGDGPNEQLARLARRGTPVVLVDHRAADGGHCAVTVDDVLGGRLAAEHLVALGHRRIGYVGGPFTLPQVRDRHEGARPVVTAAGGELVVLETPALTVEQGRTAGDRLADQSSDERPTAVFCANDLLSLGVLQAMTARGLAVPQELAIIGYDDIGYAAAAAIPLSSVRQPREQLGRAATRLLLAEIAAAQPHTHQQVMFEPELVVRESTAGRSG
jgi:LacI family transcriptional regulator